MLRVPQQKIHPYGIAIFAVVLALLLTLLLKPLLAPSVFMLFFAAVAASTWYGNLMSGLVATFLSTALIDYFFIDPVHSFAIESLRQLVRLGAFTGVTLFIGSLNSQLVSAKKRLQISLLKLKESEERYRRIVETMNEGIWNLNAEGKTDFANLRMAQMLGYTPEELQGRSLFDFIDRSEHTRAEQTLAPRTTGSAEQYDWQLRRRDGSELSTLVSVSSIFNETGEFIGTQAIITDISDRLITREQLQLALEAAKMVVWDWNLVTDEWVCSENLKQIFGLDPGTFGGTFDAFLERVDPQDRELVKSAIDRAIEERTDYNLEFRIRFPDETIHWILAKGRAFYDRSDKPASMRGVGMDITDRKQAEQSLGESQQLFETFMNHSPAAAYIKDEVGQFIYVNPLLERVWNRPIAEWIGKTDFDLFPTEIAQQYRDRDLAVLAEGQLIKYLETSEQENGTHYWLSLKFPIQYPDGGCLVAGISLDVTESKRLEEALRDSEARFKRLFDSNIIGIIFTDLLTGQIEDANDAFLEMVGYTREELEAGNVSWIDMTPPEYRHLDENGIEEIRETGVCIPFEKEYVSKEGRHIPILLAGALLEGTEHKSVAFVLDLTERKQAEAALRESEERFRMMADAAPVPIWMSGTNRLCSYFNKAWLDFTGRTLEQEMGNGWSEGVHPDDFQFCLDTYVNAFNARQEFRMEYRLRRFDGEYRWIFDIGSPRFTEEGDFQGYIGSCMDISDRKQAEAEIQQLNESLESRIAQRTAQLEAANQELESFAYSVSHDLRAPLRHISGFVDLLQKHASSTLDETSHRYLKIVLESTKHAGVLIDDLLAFSRMGRTHMRYTSVNLNQLVAEVQRNLDRENSDRQIRWHIKDLPKVQGDPSMLRLVVQNLMENAVKYSQRSNPAEITIDSTENEREFVVFVRDNGVGFDMRYAHKLFGVFQRLHSDAAFQGNGIGLANVRRIVHRHGGRTWAESQLHDGATFFFSVPKQPEGEREVRSLNPASNV